MVNDSTSKTMMPYMRHRFILACSLSSLVIQSGYAKCIFEPTKHAEVVVQACVAATFAPSDINVDFPQSSARYYEKDSGFSGTLLSVSVLSSNYVWGAGQVHQVNGFRLWKKGENLTLFVAMPQNQACPDKISDTISVDTDRYCCDVLPFKDRCLVPGNIVTVVISKKN